jgi:methyl-accepting chemotaxis protein
MNIRSKIILSTVAGATVTALTFVVIAMLSIRSVAAIAAVVSAFCAITVVIGLYIADNITKPLDAAIGIVREMNRWCLDSRFNLRRGDEIGAMVKALDTLRQTTKAASQALSAGDIEEVSRGISDISSMTNRNADITYQAKLSATEAFAAALTGDAAMKRMERAVNLIKISSDNNSKIVKMVNYMAIRANILAFNAAIEAAHTDEDGNGFAIVANEVRNFALRCSMTAKNITDMIEESAEEIDDGVKITEDAVRYINKIVDRTDNLDRMIDKLAEASGEQAQCIRRVKTSLAAKYAAFPYKRTFSATTLAFWAPERVEAEEIFTIDDCEKWR